MDRKYPLGVSIWIKSIHIGSFGAFFSKQNDIAVLKYTAQNSYGSSGKCVLIIYR
jgi:hypothetical protein